MTITDAKQTERANKLNIFISYQIYFYLYEEHMYTEENRFNKLYMTVHMLSIEDLAVNYKTRYIFYSNITRTFS